MTLKAYIWGMRFVTLFSIVALISIVLYLDPGTSGLAGKALFYSALFFTLSGFFNLFFLRLRRSITTEETAFHNAGLSLRQSILLASLCIGLLILQANRVLVWWVGLLLLAGIFLIELYFLSRE